MSADLTQARLKELLHYEQETGIFTWRVDRGGKARAGSVAGNLRCDGYTNIKIDRRDYLAHRLVFLYMTGAWPSEQLDHMNGVRANNRFANLREATNAENAHNIGGPRSDNTSGYLGVTWHKAARKWQAHIKLNGRKHHIGYFTDVAEAARAHLSAKDKHHPTHQRLREARP